MESSAREIHENLNAVIDYQTHHRLRETQGRHRAEDLNERIMIWSIFVTVAIFMVGLGQVGPVFIPQNIYHWILQVFVLKSFFSEKRPSQMYGAHWNCQLVIQSCDFGIRCESWTIVTLASAIPPQLWSLKVGTTAHLGTMICRMISQ